MQGPMFQLGLDFKREHEKDMGQSTRLREETGHSGRKHEPRH